MKNIIFILCLFTFVGCANPKDLVYQDVKNFSVSKISMKPEMGMDVQFFNPNTYSMNIKDANIDLYINDKLVGHSFTEEKYKIPASDTFLLPVKLTADLSGVLNNALQLMANKEVNIRLQGSVKAGRRGVLIPIPIRYEGRKKLNVF